MSTDTASKLRDAFVALLAPDMNSTAVAIVDAVLQQEYNYKLDRPFDANSNSTSVHTLDPSTNVQMVIKSCKFVCRANVTADNTNNATFQLVYNNGNSGSDTVICSANTATTAGSGLGNITLEVPIAVTMNVTNAIVPAGSQLQVKVTKSGAGGLSLPASNFCVKAAGV